MGKMVLMNQRHSQKHVFFFRPPGRRKLLQYLGAIDLLCAAFFFIAGLSFLMAKLAGDSGAPSFGVGYGIIFIVVGFLPLWAGTFMTTNDVVVSMTSIRSAGPPRRRVKREDVVSIDTVRKDLGKLMRVVPIMNMKDGSTVPLTPLAWNPRSPDTSLGLERQEQIVSEIRELIGVDGVNYTNS